MKKGIAKYTAFCLAAGLVIGNGQMVSMAAGPEKSLVGLKITALTPETEESDAPASGDLDETSEEAQVSEDKTEDLIDRDTEEEPVITNTEENTEIPIVTDTAGLEQLIEEARALTGRTAASDTSEAAENAEEAPLAEEAQVVIVDSEEEDAPEPAPEEAENTASEETAAKEEAPEEVSQSEEASQPEEAAEPDPEPEETEPELDTSMVGTTGFAQCSEYLNVRASGDAEGDVVGKIYNNGSLEILDVDANGWYHVRSGNVEGYVAGMYVATGEEAEEIAASSGYTTAEVGAEVLNMRADPSTDSGIVGSVENSQKIEVVEDLGDWVKVVTDDGVYGYVSADYVYTSTEYATGETLEEEQARLDEEWLDYLAEQEALAVSGYYDDYSDYGGSYDYSGDYSYYSDAAAQAQAEADWAYQVALEAQAAADAAAAAAYDYSSSYSGGSDAQVQADYLYQEYLNAQAAADEAVANGYDEQTIINTAAAAQSAYGAYVEAQNAADYANQAAADAAAQAEAQAAADAAAQAAAEAQAAADAAAAQAQAEADAAAAAAAEAQAQADAAAAQAQYQESQSVSSAGQSVANYACQFVGNPYVWGGSSLTGGADCSGFTMAVYQQFGISLPHNAAAQSGCGSAVSMDNLQPGDLIFYGNGISHVAMYIGGGSVVHASNSTNGIIISSYNYRSPVCARRYI